MFATGTLWWEQHCGPLITEVPDASKAENLVDYRFRKHSQGSDWLGYSAGYRDHLKRRLRAQYSDVRESLQSSTSENERDLATPDAWLGLSFRSRHELVGQSLLPFEDGIIVCNSSTPHRND